ncbi:NmrA family NAD(P)-binding protein [Streptomyces sp. NPDC049954]|uniref:NmrA family NAD(P)-binding protein n=1 Tax=Streptomyces sp. NPDC049954 TaxID=3155779 RepID=UPI00341447EB
MRGVETVYYVGPALHPDERATGFAAIDAAQRAGGTHFVLSSVLQAIITDLIQHEIKRDIEECLASSGLEFTILQPANYRLRHRLVPCVRSAPVTAATTSSGTPTCSRGCSAGGPRPLKSSSGGSSAPSKIRWSSHDPARRRYPLP